LHRGQEFHRLTPCAVCAAPPQPSHTDPLRGTIQPVVLVCSELTSSGSAYGTAQHPTCGASSTVAMLGSAHPAAHPEASALPVLPTGLSVQKVQQVMRERVGLCRMHQVAGVDRDYLTVTK